MKKFSPEVQETYKNAIKLGYLHKLKNYFGVYLKWKVYFFVLTNVGFLYFDKPGVKIFLYN